MTSVQKFGTMMVSLKIGVFIKFLLSALLFISAATFSKESLVLNKNNTIHINDAFYGETVAKIMEQAHKLDSVLKSGDPIILFIDSPGGSIQAGLDMIAFLNGLGRPVVTLCNFCASMGFMTVQGVTGTRYITEHGTLMSHKARGVFYGEFPGQIDSRYMYYLKRLARLDKVVVDRTNGKQTLESYRDLYENEYWCESYECVAQGFADKVVKASCDETFSGTHKEIYDRFISGNALIEIVIEMANCPLSVYPLSYNILINGTPLFTDPQDLGKKEENNFFISFNTAEVQEDKREIVRKVEKKIQEQVFKRTIIYGY